MHTLFSPRNLKFSQYLGEELAQDWCCGHRFATAFFNALSLTFPAGEQFFVDAVKAHRSLVREPRLLRDVRSFTGQEHVHSREHQAYNDQLCRARGYLQVWLEALSSFDLDRARARGPRACLADTVALEHLFALLSLRVVRMREEAGSFPSSGAVADLWYWHASEELEHRHVAFEVARIVGISRRERAVALIRTVRSLTTITIRSIEHMIEKERFLERLRIRWQGFRWLYGRKGFLKGLPGELLLLARSDFHPCHLNMEDLRSEPLDALSMRYGSNSPLPVNDQPPLRDAPQRLRVSDPAPRR